MLKIQNPYFSLELPNGWNEHPEQETLEALHFVESKLGREVIINGIGLRACPSLDELRAELARIVRTEQLALMKEKQAISGEAVELKEAGEIEFSFSATFAGGVRVQSVRTTIEARDEAHIVHIFSLTEISREASIGNLKEEFEILKGGLICLP